MLPFGKFRRTVHLEFVESAGFDALCLRCHVLFAIWQFVVIAYVFTVYLFQVIFFTQKA